jgi:hypothetical protein
MAADNLIAVGRIRLKERNRRFNRRKKRLKDEDIADRQAQRATPNPDGKTRDHERSWCADIPHIPSCTSDDKVSQG